MILVTGVAGFIGYNTCKFLLEKGEFVIGIDNFSTGLPSLVKRLQYFTSFKFVEVSITDYSALELIFDTYSIKSVLHLAALPRVKYSFDYPIETNQVNIQGTLNLLTICQKSEIQKIVFASSSSVYGNQLSYPLVENMTPNPMSPYGIQKLTSEKYCKLFFETYNLPILILRYFNVYGDTTSEMSNYSCFLPKIINQVKNGINPTIFGNGEQARDFTHISDIVNANYIALKSENKKANGEVFNIGFGKPLSVNFVFNTVKDVINKNISYITQKLEFNEPIITWADNIKAKDILGWQPTISFVDGLNLYLSELSNYVKP